MMEKQILYVQEKVKEVFGFNYHKEKHILNLNNGTLLGIQVN